MEECGSDFLTEAEAWVLSISTTETFETSKLSVSIRAMFQWEVCSSIAMECSGWAHSVTVFCAFGATRSNDTDTMKGFPGPPFITFFKTRMEASGLSPTRESIDLQTSVY